MTDKAELMPGDVLSTTRGQKSACGKFELAQRDSNRSALVQEGFRDKNVIVSCSERGEIDQNGSKPSSGKRSEILSDQLLQPAPVAAAAG